MGTWRGYQGGNAVDEFQRCEVQLVCLGTASVSVEVAAGFAVLLAAAVDQLAAGLAQALHGKGWTGAIAQQTLQRSAVVGFDADTGIDREAAVFVALHVFGVTALQQAPCNEGAQDAFLQGGLHLGHGRRIDAAGRVEYDTWRRGLHWGISAALALHSLKHPVHHANVEVDVFVQAGAEPVNEGHCADVQARLVCIGRARAMGLQALCNDGVPSFSVQ